jgi:hypothetical protein
MNRVLNSGRADASNAEEASEQFISGSIMALMCASRRHPSLTVRIDPSRGYPPHFIAICGHIACSTNTNGCQARWFRLT